MNSLTVPKKKAKLIKEVLFKYLGFYQDAGSVF